MKTKLIFITAVILSSCMGPASVVQFTEEENLIQVFDDLPGTKSELFLKANNWMVETFNIAESVIQHSDKEEGAIIGKYLMYGSTISTQYGTIDSRVFAVIDIRVKDNKARLEIKPQGKWYNGGWTGVYNFSKADAILEMEKLTESLYNEFMKENIDF